MIHTNPKKIFYRIFFICFAIFFSQVCYAQKEFYHKENIFRDSLDGKLDLSRYIIDAKGFVPVPFLVTQPALGGFGGGVAPLFISPKKRPTGYKGYIPPDITTGFGMYTANKSWATGVARMGSFPSLGIKYRALVGYMDVNLSYYHTFDLLGEKEFDFNIKAAPVFVSLSKKIIQQNIYAGLQYLYSKTVLKPNFTDSVPSFIKEKELNSKIGSLGTFLEFDNRNTIFTPSKGMKINLLLNIDDNWTGSDYQYQKLKGYINGFIPVKKNWICGLHLDVQQAFGDVPFYLLPDINMEGIPTARYQGTTTIVTQTEQRIDITYRWSLVFFGGVGKTIGKDQTFKDGTTVYNYGTGFRYFLARAFGLRAGIDVAGGPGSWGYYIVFGQSWNK
jgi:hypothetical protein